MLRFGASFLLNPNHIAALELRRGKAGAPSEIHARIAGGRAFKRAFPTAQSAEEAFAYYNRLLASQHA